MMIKMVLDINGYKCAIAFTNPLNIHCGYVILDESHPLYGEKNYCEGVLSKIEVHGGITFADDARKISGNEDEKFIKGWAIGFDCGHADDICDFNIINFLTEGQNNERTFKDEDFVIGELCILTLQLDEIKNGPYN
jgi:hypothetical protein